MTDLENDVSETVADTDEQDNGGAESPEEPMETDMDSEEFKKLVDQGLDGKVAREIQVIFKEGVWPFF